MILNSPAFAFESYILISNFPIKNYSTNHTDIISIKRNFNIYDDKKTLILTPLKEGLANILIEYKNSHRINFNVEVTKNKTNLPKIEGLDFYLIEKPVLPTIFDTPPTKLGGHK